MPERYEGASAQKTSLARHPSLARGASNFCAAAIIALLGLDVALSQEAPGGFPVPLPAKPRSADVTGNWQFIPVPLPERNVTHLLVSSKRERIWVGTTGGVASYDGVAARVPSFPSASAEQSIYVNSLVEMADGSVLVGTINDSIWKWEGDKISAIYGACPRSEGTCARGEWSFARPSGGPLYVASSSFAPGRTQVIEALRAAISDPIVLVQDSAAYLGFSGQALVATSQYGKVSIIDRASGKPSRQFDLGVERGTFVRNVSYGDGVIFVGTDKNCLGLLLAEGSLPTVMAEGNCTAVYAQGDGTTWLSTDGLSRHDRQGWKRWGPGQSGALRASAIAADDMGNVWIGAPNGLWRYFDLAREYAFSGERSRITSMVHDADGGVVVGLEGGEAWRLSRNFAASRIELPSPSQTAASPYYRGALLAVDAMGHLWVLNAAGLFKIDGPGPQRVADYPIPSAERSAAPSSLAISAQGKICAGLIWQNNTVCVVDGKWRDSVEVMGDIGGSAVSALSFDGNGTLLAVGVKSIGIAGASNAELGPFSPMPFGRKHLFGAIAATSLAHGADIVAAGGWGGTTFLKRSGQSFSEVGRSSSVGQEQPYLIRQFSAHPGMGLLAGSDEGLFRWEGTAADGQWKSLRDIDPRFADAIDGVVASGQRGVWIASGSRLSLINLPTAEPQALIERSPSSETIDINAVTYQISVPGLVGSPLSKTTTIAYDPLVANAERILVGPKNRLDLTNLADLTSYRLTATVTDGFLNSGPAMVSGFSVELPFYRNPYKLGTSIVAGLTLAGLLLTRRGPTGFLLQRLGGLRWSTERSDPRFAIEVKGVGPDIVRYDLDAPSALTLIRLSVDLPMAELNDEPKDVLPHLVGVADGSIPASRTDFASDMAKAATDLGERAFPPSLRFVTSQFDGGAISFDMSKSLLWLPLELVDDGGGPQVLLRYATGRTVTGDVLAEAAPLRTSRLKVAIFAPHTDAPIPYLPEIEAEARFVAAAARRWGAQVDLVRPDATKAEVLEVLRSAHIFHYAGHAEFMPDQAGQSYLPIRDDRIMAEDIATALSSGPHNLLLAFINGCGSSREASWDRGADVYGFASAFLNNATYFIGTQWPIHDEFAAPLASEFYTRLFPTSYSLWWRLVRRGPLHGVPFAEALRMARRAVSEHGPAATQTWSAYIFYGDPTRRLVLS